MATDNQNKEKAFRQGQQDNTIQLDPSDAKNPKTSITNQDKKITNEDEQKILTDELDDHGSVTENRDENPSPTVQPGTDIPDVHTTAFRPGKTERELPELSEDD